MKILMRAGMNFFEDQDIFDILAYDKISTNSGNVLFWTSVARWVMVDDDTIIDTIKTHNVFFDDEEINRINNTYDYFLIPLANAFRPTFVNELKDLTDLINKLTIPCVVIGVGLSYQFRNEALEIDNDVKNFVDAVLNKSKIIGIRGQNTANYLKFLGYEENKDYMLIGCPSLYRFGSYLPKIEKKPLDENARLNITTKYSLPENYHIFISRQLKIFKNYNLSFQNLDEIRLQYFFKKIDTNKSEYTYRPNRDYYPLDKNQEELKNCVSFVNFESWRDYFQNEIDFSFGNRIHGSIAALLSGVPAFIVACDGRVEELAKYHKIPYTTPSKLKDKTILDFYNSADYDTFLKTHKKNFENYREFMNLNGVKHIFENTDYVEEAPYDKKIKTVVLAPAVPRFNNSFKNRAFVYRKRRNDLNKVIKLKRRLYREELKKRGLLNNDI